MKLIIEIDEDVRIAITRIGLLRIPDEMQKKVDKAIQSGTPLPKGHGRILDEKDILNIENNDGGWYDLVDMPEYIAGVKAIIEADKDERSDKE